MVKLPASRPSCRTTMESRLLGLTGLNFFA